jgi:hypothetical protein
LGRKEIEYCVPSGLFTLIHTAHLTGSVLLMLYLSEVLFIG